MPKTLLMYVIIELPHIHTWESDIMSCIGETIKPLRTNDQVSYYNTMRIQRESIRAIVKDLELKLSELKILCLVILFRWLVLFHLCEVWVCFVLGPGTVFQWQHTCTEPLSSRKKISSTNHFLLNTTWWPPVDIWGSEKNSGLS